MEKQLQNGLQSSSAVALDPEVSALREAMGPVICAALDDPDVVEILLNFDGMLWVERLSNGRTPLDATLSAAEGERIIRAVATRLGVEVHRGQPLVCAVLPGTGDRFDGALPPVASGPAFALRKRAVGVIPLTCYVHDGVMTGAQAEFLRSAVRDRLNILIAGGRATGKTTLANTLLAEMAGTGEGVLVLEDQEEFHSTSRHHVPLRTGAGVVGMTELICAAVRLRPDRVIVGEVRGGEALDILKLWNRSRPGGLTTIQAGSAQGALLQLEQLIPPWTHETPRALIAQTIHVVVYLVGKGRERRLDRLARVGGFDDSGYRLVDDIGELGSAGPASPTSG